MNYYLRIHWRCIALSSWLPRFFQPLTLRKWLRIGCLCRRSYCNMQTRLRRKHVAVSPVGSCPCTSPVLDPCIYPLAQVSWIWGLERALETHNLGMDWRRPAHGRYRSANLVSPCANSCACDFCPAYIDFCILESFLQVIVDSFVRDLAQECKIRDAHFLLLSALKDGLLDLGLSASIWSVCAAGIFLTAGTLRDTLKSRQCRVLHFNRVSFKADHRCLPVILALCLPERIVFPSKINFVVFSVDVEFVNIIHESNWSKKY